MPGRCSLCNYPDQAAVRLAFSDGLSDRAIARRFGMSHVAVGNHRKEHLLKPMAAAVDLLDRGTTQRQQREKQLAAIKEGDPVAVAGAMTAFSREAQLNKVAVNETTAARVGRAAECAGLYGVAIQAVSQQLKAVEVGSKLAQIGGYKQPHTPPQSDERGRWTITMVFPNAGKVEEIRLAEAPGRRAAEQAMAQPGTRSRLEIDVPQVPQEVDGASLRSCAAITPEVDKELIERLVYRPVPDEQAED